MPLNLFHGPMDTVVGFRWWQQNEHGSPSRMGVYARPTVDSGHSWSYTSDAPFDMVYPLPV